MAVRGAACRCRFTARIRHPADSAIRSRKSEICIYGRVVNEAGEGISEDCIEIWQCDDEGLFDLHKLDPAMMDLRGWFHADEEGCS